MGELHRTATSTPSSLSEFREKPAAMSLEVARMDRIYHEVDAIADRGSSGGSES
jgi:hypothetical protein